MLTVKLHELGSVSDKELTRVVCVSEYNGKWVYSKHKERKLGKFQEVISKREKLG